MKVHVGSQNYLFLFSAVSAETLQKNLDLMGLQIKKLEKTLETFPPPQSDKDLFVEKLSISFYFSFSYYRHATTSYWCNGTGVIYKILPLT